ncbi:hypothetical protein D3C81_697070 [compost metagenome]
MKMTAAVEQLELEPGQLRQVVGTQCAVAMDQLAGDAAGVGHAQPAEVAQDLLHRVLVGFHPPAAVFPGVTGGLFAQHLEQGVGIGQARVEARGQCFEFWRQLDLGAHQHQHMRLAVAALDDVAQQALVAGVAQVGVEIEQQVDAALVGLLDHPQRRAGVGRAGGLVLAVDVDAAQALGDGPAVQCPPYVHQRLPEQLDDPRLVLGLDDDQRRVGADQRGKVLQFAHGGSVRWRTR